MTKLTKKEKAWVDELQAVLDKCPSPKKIGFYTTGDSSIMLYDLRKIYEVTRALDCRDGMEWHGAVMHVGAEFDETLDFPSSVESTAG